jgi:hypothetical protein
MRGKQGAEKSSGTAAAPVLLVGRRLQRNRKLKLYLRASGFVQHFAGTSCSPSAATGRRYRRRFDELTARASLTVLADGARPFSRQVGTGNRALTLAAQMKSFSESPPMAWVL